MNRPGSRQHDHGPDTDRAGRGAGGAGPGGPSAVLIGPPGAGKSTVGPLVAALLGLEFADTDDRVEDAASKPVSDIFIEDGEAAFRALEREAVAQAIVEHRGVLGLGGGAVLDEGTQALLAGQPVVYLETGFAEAAKRVGLDRPRPLLLGSPRTRLKALLDQRLPVYQRLAWITVRTDGRTPDQIAADIAVRIQKPAGQPAADRAGSGPAALDGDQTGGPVGAEFEAGTGEPG